MHVQHHDNADFQALTPCRGGLFSTLANAAARSHVSIHRHKPLLTSATCCQRQTQAS